MEIVLKRFYLVMVAMILLSSIVMADSSVEVTPVKNQIAPDENGVYTLKVTNTDKIVQKYSIYSLQTGQGWTMDPSPLTDKFFELSPGQSKEVKLLVTALQAFTPGIHTVQLSLQSSLGDVYLRSLKVYLGKEQDLEYLPSIRATVDMDEKINAKEPLSIRLFIDNGNPLDLSNLTVRIQSDIPEFEKEVSINLLPLEKKNR